MNPIELSIFAGRINAVCEEMGAQLRRAAFSPNIRDRLDFSCAVFDEQGELCAQAAHIPVHLGSMAYAMRDIVKRLSWRPGDAVILNDPYRGGTHLPDVTVIAPLFVDGECAGFVANRAHHADIGAESPGSMPVSTSLDEEGVLIPPTFLYRDGARDEKIWNALLSRFRNPDESAGDFSAQLAANQRGLARLNALVEYAGLEDYRQALRELDDYAGRLANAALQAIPRGRYRFRDVMDDDGLGNQDIAIQVEVVADHDGITVDFSGTDAQVPGNINCPLPVTAAAVFYVFRCLMPPQTPASAGAFRPIRIVAPPGSLVNAQAPAAVAAGNVETSTRIVDVVIGALQQALPSVMPAASHGSMNNVALGCATTTESGPAWDYYETIGGGMGAGPGQPGAHAVQTHMTNTLNTSIEVLEMRYPLRVTEYSVRRGSGGIGRHCGGDGIIREFEFLAPAQGTVLTERRRHAPWGLAGGEPGQPGRNLLNGKPLPPKATFRLKAGDRLRIETPGGGGYGKCNRE
jgi:N-methylhydantoinase B